jgi:hypothetical protein
MFSRILRQKTLPLQKRYFTENFKKKIKDTDLPYFYLKGSLFIGMGFAVYRYNHEFKEFTQDYPFSTAILSVIFGMVDGFAVPGIILFKSAEGLDKIYQNHIKNKQKED